MWAATRTLPSLLHLYRLYLSSSKDGTAEYRILRTELVENIEMKTTGINPRSSLSLLAFYLLVMANEVKLIASCVKKSDHLPISRTATFKRL
jgi:hypothetical protein